MRTSRASWLTPPEGDTKISEGTFGYLTARVRQRAYDIVVREFKRCDLTKAQLARRWGKDPAFVTRFLSQPGNWELDTYTEALFAISGAIPETKAIHPFADTKASIQVSSRHDRLTTISLQSELPTVSTAEGTTKIQLVRTTMPSSGESRVDMYDVAA